MSTINEVTSQADYIAAQRSRLSAQWQAYHRTLINGITHSKIIHNHELICGHNHDARFLLFDHFMIRIQLNDDFYSRDICYCINVATPDQAERLLPFAHATLDENGTIDGSVNNRDTQAVTEHYLMKISVIYQCLFNSMHDNHSAHKELEKIILNR
ncbi:formate hydrogenlyase regulatory protein HycA [Biostraticola tofi]|uniref:Formate hydrogenlyase regulatory protein HycA n=2 Tax=Biostraticola tofi TaxID=466109 RepID=A0A4R3Z2C2_9GAMM|nr:formate hydrogenlyase regulatory protein HycA [Biostraticola tofi]